MRQDTFCFYTSSVLTYFVNIHISGVEQYFWTGKSLVSSDTKGPI